MDALQVFKMHRHTGDGEHYWTNWGPWFPNRNEPVQAFISEGPPTDTPIQAHRFRTCPCGALEQEDYQGKRQYWSRDDDR